MPTAPKRVKAQRRPLAPKNVRYGKNWDKISKAILAMPENRFCWFCKVEWSTQVHHKDHNKANNAPDNLVGVDARCHALHHKGAF